MAAPLHLRSTRRQRDKNFFVVWRVRRVRVSLLRCSKLIRPTSYRRTSTGRIWRTLSEPPPATIQDGLASPSLRTAAKVLRALLASGRTKMQLAYIVSRNASPFFLFLMAIRLWMDADFFAVKTTAQFGWEPVVHHFDASSQPPTLLKCNCANISANAVGPSESQSRTSCTATTAALGVGATSHWHSTPPLGPYITPLQCRGLTVLGCNARVQPPASQPARYRWPFSSNFMPTNVCRAPIGHANGISFARPGMEVPYRPPRSLNRSESRKPHRQHKLSTGRDIGRNHAISWTCAEKEAGNVRDYSNGPSSKDWQPLSKNATGLKFASGSVIVNGAPQRLRSQWIRLITDMSILIRRALGKSVARILKMRQYWLWWFTTDNIRSVQIWFSIITRKKISISVIKLYLLLYIFRMTKTSTGRPLLGVQLVWV